jgi:hypothetical protein
MLNWIQQGMMKRATRQFLSDPDFANEMSPMLQRQTMKAVAGLKEADVAAMITTGDFSSLATTISKGLVANEGADANTVGTGPFLTMLQQLLAMLLPMLTACIPVAAGTPGVTAQQVLAAIQ